MEQNGGKFFSPARIAAIAMFSALAGILYIFNFPIPFAFPGFLEFKFSDIPVLIGAFALGPVSGAVIVVIQILIKLVFTGTSTAFVGELSDLLTCCAFAVTAGLIYSKKRTFKGALIAIAAGTAAEVVVALLANRFILVPFFVKQYGWGAIIGMMLKLFPKCTEQNFYNYYLWVSVLPFNLLRCIVAALVTLPVYKRISNVLNKFNDKITPKDDGDGKKAKRVNLAVILAFAGLVALLITFALLRYFVF